MFNSFNPAEALRSKDQAGDTVRENAQTHLSGSIFEEMKNSFAPGRGGKSSGETLETLDFGDPDALYADAGRRYESASGKAVTAATWGSAAAVCGAAEIAEKAHVPGAELQHIAAGSGLAATAMDIAEDVYLATHA